jgi:hypothetical protein
VAAVVAGLPVLPREERVGHVPPLLHCPVRQRVRPEEQLQLDWPISRGTVETISGQRLCQNCLGCQAERTPVLHRGREIWRCVHVHVWLMKV